MRSRLIAGDSIDVMKRLKKESVDMVFVDPPFNLNKKYQNTKDNHAEMEYLQWCNDWLDQCVNILKPTGTLLVHNIPKWLISFGSYLNSKGMKFRHWIAWDAMGSPLGKTLLPSHYGILYYTKSDTFTFNDIRIPHKKCKVCNEVQKDYGGKKYLLHPFGTISSDIWTDIHRIRHTKRRDAHPCQLPEPLLERLIMMTTNENDLVLDPMMGAGTTILASKRLHRKYIGIDIAQMYVDITREKLKEVIVNQTNNYVYKYNKVGQTRTSFVKSSFGKIPHTLTNKNIQVNGKLLEGEQSNLYFKYNFKILPR